MLLLSISATGIIFIRKGGGRGGGRSGSLRYAPQTNLCFLNYLCQLRFYKLNKSITQVYFEPAGCPRGSVAHLPAHLCAVPREGPGHTRRVPSQSPTLTGGRVASSAGGRPQKAHTGAAVEGCGLPTGARPRQSHLAARQSEAPKGDCSGDAVNSGPAWQASWRIHF